VVHRLNDVLVGSNVHARGMAYGQGGRGLFDHGGQRGAWTVNQCVIVLSYQLAAMGGCADCSPACMCG
jgi:hypothetical protein